MIEKLEYEPAVAITRNQCSSWTPSLRVRRVTETELHDPGYQTFGMHEFRMSIAYLEALLLKSYTRKCSTQAGVGRRQAPQEFKSPCFFIIVRILHVQQFWWKPSPVSLDETR